MHTKRNQQCEELGELMTWSILLETGNEISLSFSEHLVALGLSWS